MNRFSKHLPTAARLLLGLVFTVFGLNFFLHFLPTPAAMASVAKAMSWTMSGPSTFRTSSPPGPVSRTW